jgi:hypothetical protein
MPCAHDPHALRAAAPLTDNSHCTATALQVRDQRVRLQQHPQRGMLVRALDRAETKGDGSGQLPLQFVASFTMDDWQVLRRAVGKRACLMRSRAAPHA